MLVIPVLGHMSGIPILGISLIDFGWIVLGLLAMFVALSVVVLSLTWLERTSRKCTNHCAS